MKHKLKEVLAIQTSSYNQFRMFAYIIRQLKGMGIAYYVDNGNIYAIKGEAISYPCIVAHMDTVHKVGSDLSVLEFNGNLTGFNRLTMQQSGIGGDDKVGIFIALQCLDFFDNIKAVFFRDEEVGCVGSYEADFDFFNDCDFVLQCDRKGSSDFVTNACGIQLSSKAFQKAIKGIIKSYGYNFTSGLMTDVMALKEGGIKCSMANISCGYYRPHCDDEYVNIWDVNNCLDMVKDIIYSIAGKYYPCDYVAPTYTKYDKKDTAIISSWKDYNKAGDDWYYTDKKKVKDYCEGCDLMVDDLTYVSQFSTHLCKKCINDYVNYYNTELPF